MPEERRFDRGAWLVLAFALIFIVLDVAQLVYRFSLPTEGWLVNTSEQDENSEDFLLSRNLVGVPSPLQPGDRLIIIGGIPVEQILQPTTTMFSPPPPGWQVGGQVLVTVIRNGQMLTFDIPIVRWTLATWWQTNFSDPLSIISWLSVLILLGAGVFTFLNRPQNLAARFLFLFGMTWLAISVSSSLPDVIGFYFDAFTGYVKALFSFVIFAYLLGPSLLGFALTFPRPKAFIQRHPAWLLVPFVIGLIPPLLLFTLPSLAVLGFPITLGMVVAAIASLLHSAVTMRDAISRAQLRWAIGGVVIGLALFTLNYVPNLGGSSALRDLFHIFPTMGFPVMGISLGIAITRYHLFDIEVIIRRTLTYALVTGVSALVFFGSVILLQQLFAAITGSRQNELVTVLSTLAIAALFVPVRNRIQSEIDRRFNRKKYDAHQVLQDFANTVRDETDLEKLTARLMEVVDETMQPRSVSVWLKLTTDRSTRSDSARRLDSFW